MFIYCICTQYLVGAPFALITASIRRGMEVISLWHCWGGMEAQVSLTVAFRSSCIVGSGVSQILYGVQVRQVCWPIKHSNTMVIEPAFGTFGSVGRCQVLLENEISIFIKVDGRCCVDCGLQKTQWTNTSRWHGSPNHHWLWKLHTGLQATWILCLSTLPPDSGTLISKWNAKFLSSEKRTLDHWATVEFFFSTAQVRCFWRCLWFRRGLVALFLKTSEHGDSALTPASVHSLWSSPKCLNQLCLTVFSSLRSSLLLVHLFLPKFFLPVNFAFNMLWYSTL